MQNSEENLQKRLENLESNFNVSLNEKVTKYNYFVMYFFNIDSLHAQQYVFFFKFESIKSQIKKESGKNENIIQNSENELQMRF